jgi:hypothetical protein
MTFTAGLVLILVGLSATACDGDSSYSEPSPTPHSRSANPSAVATRPTVVETSPAEVEVQGVVGAVNAQAQTIAIRPTGEASFSTIVVDSATRILRAGGGTGRLSDIRSSDRIIATGVPGDDPETLIASEITIQQVIPGAQPGG